MSKENCEGREYESAKKKYQGCCEPCMTCTRDRALTDNYKRAEPEVMNSEDIRKHIGVGADDDQVDYSDFLLYGSAMRQDGQLREWKRLKPILLWFADNWDALDDNGFVPPKKLKPPYELKE